MVSFQEDISHQLDDRLIRLDRAVMSGDVEQIRTQTQGVCGLRNILGPFVLSDFQRRRLRAIASEIDKLDITEQERTGLFGAADSLRSLSTLRAA